MVYSWRARECFRTQPSPIKGKRGISPMSKIEITPPYSEVKPEGFYVYIHRRATDNSVFYVGKGKLNRGWGGNRNRYWRFISQKNGILIEIVKDRMSEKCAFELEVELIDKYRGLGFHLANYTNGGEGASGLMSTRRKKVYCSNGMVFLHTQEVAEWLVGLGNEKATAKLVSAAALGNKNTIYGYCFSYTGVPKQPLLTGKAAQIEFFGSNRKTVYCSNGEVYSSGSDASLAAYGHSGGASKIFQCCDGIRKSAGGFTWAYNPDDLATFVEPSVSSSRAKWKRVGCENGMVFESMFLAKKWLEKQNGVTYSDSVITQSLRRGGKCGGYNFFRIDPKKKSNKGE